MSNMILSSCMSFSFFQYVISVFVFVIAPYLIGAIPSGYIFAKFFFNVDITQQGSGNIGATNSARVLGGIKYFFLIFFLDAGKAFCCLCFLKSIFHCSYMLTVAAIMLLIGNSYSCFLGGRGGKGVATLVGIVFAFAPLYFTCSLLLIWLLLFAFFRKVDAASLVSLIVSLCIYGVFFYEQFPEFFYFLLFAFVFLSIRHQSNIRIWIKDSSKKL